MKLILLSAIILTLTANYSDCAPKDQSTSKKVTFSDTLDLIDPPDVPDGVFVMNYKRFDDNVKEKCKQYDKKSKEYKFLLFISVVVEETYLMWDHMYRAVNLLDNYAVCLSQTERVFRGNTMFPDSNTFEKLEKHKNHFKERFAFLLRSIEPAYEINEEIIPLVDCLKNDTEIDLNLLTEMFATVKDVVSISNEFDDAFKYAFSTRPKDFFTIERASKGSVVKVAAEKECNQKKTVMKMYRKSLSDVRVVVIDLECNQIPLSTASAALNKNLEMLDQKIYPEIQRSLNYAKPIDFGKLQEAMAHFRSLAQRALNIEEGSSSK